MNAEKRERLHRELDMAERHVMEGAEHVRRQRALLRRLQAEGDETRAAEDLLRTFENSQALHVRGRDRILQELSLLPTDSLATSPR